MRLFGSKEKSNRGRETSPWSKLAVASKPPAAFFKMLHISGEILSLSGFELQVCQTVPFHSNLRLQHFQSTVSQTSKWASLTQGVQQTKRLWGERNKGLWLWSLTQKVASAFLRFLSGWSKGPRTGQLGSAGLHRDLRLSAGALMDLWETALCVPTSLPNFFCGPMAMIAGWKADSDYGDVCRRGCAVAVCMKSVLWNHRPAQNPSSPRASLSVTETNRNVCRRLNICRKKLNWKNKGKREHLLRKKWIFCNCFHSKLLN